MFGIFNYLNILLKKVNIFLPVIYPYIFWPLLSNMSIAFWLSIFKRERSKFYELKIFNYLEFIKLKLLISGLKLMLETREILNFDYFVVLIFEFEAFSSLNLRFCEIIFIFDYFYFDIKPKLKDLLFYIFYLFDWYLRISCS